MEIEIEQIISPPDPSMVDESVKSDFNVPSHVEEDSVVEEVPSENSDSESDTDVWEVIEKGTEKGNPKLVNNNGYSYVVSRVRNGTKYWRCSMRNSNMKCPATVTERCGVFTSSQASHCHSPVVGASVLTKLKVAFKEKAQSDPLAGLPIIVDEAISKHMDGKSSINNYPGVKELRLLLLLSFEYKVKVIKIFLNLFCLNNVSMQVWWRKTRKG